MRTKKNTVNPGFWYVATVRSVKTGAIDSATGHAAPTPTQAVRLVRLSLRTLTPALSPDEADRAFRWLELGQWEALHLLHHGEDFAFTVCYRDAQVEWNVRPVLFLSLRNRRGCPGAPLPPPGLPGS